MWGTWCGYILKRGSYRGQEKRSNPFRMIHSRLCNRRWLGECFLVGIASLHGDLSIIDVEDLKLFGPFVLDKEEERLLVLPSIKDLVIDVQIELGEGVILQMKADELMWVSMNFLSWCQGPNSS